MLKMEFPNEIFEIIKEYLVFKILRLYANQANVRCKNFFFFYELYQTEHFLGFSYDSFIIMSNKLKLIGIVIPKEIAKKYISDWNCNFTNDFKIYYRIKQNKHDITKKWYSIFYWKEGYLLCCDNRPLYDAFRKKVEFIFANLSNNELRFP
jgi:hypothetical protein